MYFEVFLDFEVFFTFKKGEYTKLGRIHSEIFSKSY